MRKVIKLVLLSVLLFSFSFNVFCQDTEKPKIAVLHVTNSIGGEQYNIVSNTIEDTVTLTLRLLGKYKVIENAPRLFERERTNLITYAERNALDNIIFGEIKEGEGNKIVFHLSVFSRLEKGIVNEQTETVTSLIETFDAADKLVAGLLESFSQTHVGWGTITFQNTGAQGSYDVYLDGEFISSDVRSISNVLIGNREILVKQQRPFREHILTDTEIEVIENKTVTVRFSIPKITKNESSGFRTIENTLLDAWENDTSEEAEEQFSLLFTLLEKAEASEGLLELKDKYTQWRNAYERGERIAQLEEKRQEPASASEPITAQETENLQAQLENVENRLAEIETRLQYEVSLWEFDGRLEEETGLISLLQDIELLKQEIETSFIEFQDFKQKVSTLLTKTQELITKKENRISELRTEKEQLQARYEKEKKAKKARTVAGFITLGAGVVCGGLTGLFWYLGDQAYNNYMNAATPDAVTKYKNDFITLDVITYSVGGLGVASLGVSIPLFFAGKDPEIYREEISKVESEIVRIEEDL